MAEKGSEVEMDASREDNGAKGKDCGSKGAGVALNGECRNFTYIGAAANVQHGGKMTVNMIPPEKRKSKKKKNKKSLTKSTESVSRDHMLDLKDRLGYSWKDMGRRLGFEDAELDQLEMQHRPDYSELNYQILLKWKRAKPDEATKTNLASVFLKIGRGDLSDILADENS